MIYRDLLCDNSIIYGVSWPASSTLGGSNGRHLPTAMEFYLSNLTSDSIFFRPESSKPEHAEAQAVLPNAVSALPTSEHNFILLSSGGSSDVTPEMPFFRLRTESQWIVKLKKSSFQWNPVSMSKDCPWRVYRDQVATWLYCDYWSSLNENTLQVSGKRTNILVLPKRPTESFLSDVPDATPLYSLCLPGTLPSYLTLYK
jgi:hypothetical protein